MKTCEAGIYEYLKKQITLHKILQKNSFLLNKLKNIEMLFHSVTEFVLI